MRCFIRFFEIGLNFRGSNFCGDDKNGSNFHGSNFGHENLNNFLCALRVKYAMDWIYVNGSGNCILHAHVAL